MSANLPRRTFQQSAVPLVGNWESILRPQAPGSFLAPRRSFTSAAESISTTESPIKDLSEEFTRNNKRRFWRERSNQRRFLSKLADVLGIDEVSPIVQLFPTHTYLIFRFLLWFSLQDGTRYPDRQWFEEEEPICFDTILHLLRLSKVVILSSILCPPNSSVLVLPGQNGCSPISLTIHRNNENLFHSSAPNSTSLRFDPFNSFNSIFLILIICSCQIGMPLQSKRSREQGKVVHWWGFIHPFLLHCRISILTFNGNFLASTPSTCNSHPLPRGPCNLSCSTT